MQVPLFEVAHLEQYVRKLVTNPKFLAAGEGDQIVAPLTSRQWRIVAQILDGVLRNVEARKRISGEMLN